MSFSFLLLYARSGVHMGHKLKNGEHHHHIIIYTQETWVGGGFKSAALWRVGRCFGCVLCLTLEIGKNAQINGLSLDVLSGDRLCCAVLGVFRRTGREEDRCVTVSLWRRGAWKFSTGHREHGMILSLGTPCTYLLGYLCVR